MSSQSRLVARYQQYKQAHPGKVILMPVPKLFAHAAFGHDAETVSTVCEAPMVTLVDGEQTIEAACVNSTAVMQAVGMLASEGHKVAIING
jgi:hypothetical protein